MGLLSTSLRKIEYDDNSEPVGRPQYVASEIHSRSGVRQESSSGRFDASDCLSKHARTIARTASRISALSDGQASITKRNSGAFSASIAASDATAPHSAAPDSGIAFSSGVWASVRVLSPPLEPAGGFNRTTGGGVDQAEVSGPRLFSWEKRTGSELQHRAAANGDRLR